jgi:hypothetical protein
MVFGRYSDKSIQSVKIIEIKFLIIKFYLAGTDAYSDTAFVLAILFVALSNVLLLNVLIALFKYKENFSN